MNEQVAKHDLKPIPVYGGAYITKIDDKNRLNLPIRIRRSITERNVHSLMSDEFQIVPYHGGHQALAFQGIPVVEIETSDPIIKENVNIKSIDDLLYFSPGILKGNTSPRPDFTFGNYDTIFMYAFMDAQRMLFDSQWKDCGFCYRPQKVKLDTQDRILLSNIFEEHDYAKRAIVDMEGRVIVTGQPVLFCFTLSMPPQPTL